FALRKREVDAGGVEALLDRLDQGALGIEMIRVAHVAAYAQIDAACRQFVNHDARRRLGMDARVGVHEFQGDGTGEVDIVGVADADHQLDAPHRAGREVDDGIAGDQGVGQGDELVVGAAQLRLEDADRFDLAAHAVDGDYVVDPEGGERDQHDAGGDVGQRILHRKADGKAGGAEYREHRRHRYAEDLHHGQKQHHLQDH